MSTVDLAAAVHYNRRMGPRLGWQARKVEICAFLHSEFVPVGPTQAPSEREFARMIAAWQEGENKRAFRNVLTVDGKLGPNSWRAMKSDLERKASGRRLKHLNLHILTLNPPKFNYQQAVRFALDLYGSIGIQLRFRTEVCPALNASDHTRLAVIDGQCKWDQFSSEQDDLYEKAGVSARGSGVRIFLVGGLRKPDGGTLKGCAGHAPNKPAAVIDSNIATIFTLSHEIGHVLLTSGFTPVHHSSTDNIMYRVTDGHKLANPPGFDTAQITKIRSSSLLT